MLPEGGHVITCEADYGYATPLHWHKVLLWSREPWSDMNRLGGSALPAGQFVAGTTETPVGPVRVFGCCIPWRLAHVCEGRRDRQPWQDHLQYLKALPTVLAQRNGLPAIWLGAFHQKLPLQGATAEARSALETAIQGWRLATDGRIAPMNEFAIDHILHSPDLRLLTVKGQPRVTSSGTRLCDRFGLVADLQAEGLLNPKAMAPDRAVQQKPARELVSG